MQSVTYSEIEEVYNALKRSRFAKISVDALTDGVLFFLEISDKNRILVKNGVKKFFHIWDKIRLCCEGFIKSSMHSGAFS